VGNRVSSTWRFVYDFVKIQTKATVSKQKPPKDNRECMKQLMAGGGVALIGITLVPLLSGLFG
jgi:ABC-type transporter Mla maintaining outer membrane lipid asymmetry permease subunit MlaE